MIKKSELSVLYEEINGQMTKNSDRFREYERIYEAFPEESETLEGAVKLPAITDGTTGKIIRKIGIDICPDPPTATIKTNNKALSIILQWIFNNRILPLTNEEHPFLNKCQLICESRAIYGLQFVEIVKKEVDDIMYPDFRLPYQRSIAMEPNKSAWDANYVMTKRWYSDEDIKNLLDDAKTDKTWNRKVLRQFANRAKEIPSEGDTSLSESYDKPETVAGHEMVEFYQKGKNAPFYTYAPALKKIVRERENDDPIGDIPFVPSYHHPTTTNTYGKGIAEILIGDQNFIDEKKRMHSFGSALTELPPLVGYGIDPSKVNYEPMSLISLSEPDARLEPLNLENKSNLQYHQDHSAIRSIMHDDIGVGDLNTNTAGNSYASSKTHLGVQTQVQKEDGTRKQLRWNLEFTLGHVFRQMLNCFLYYNNRKLKFYIDNIILTEIVKYIDTVDEKIMNVAEDANGSYVELDFSNLNPDVLEEISMTIDPDWDIDKAQRARALLDMFNTFQTNQRAESRMKIENFIVQIMKDLKLAPEKYLLSEAEAPMPQIMTPELTTQTVRDIIQNEGSSIDKSKLLEVKQQELELKEQQLQHERQLEMRKLEMEEMKIKADFLAKTGQMLPDQVLAEEPQTPDELRQQGISELITEALKRGATPSQQAQLGALLSQVQNGIVSEANAEIEFNNILNSREEIESGSEQTEGSIPVPATPV